MGRWSFIQHIEPDSHFFLWVGNANFQHYNLIDDLLKDGPYIHLQFDNQPLIDGIGGVFMVYGGGWGYRY